MLGILTCFLSIYAAQSQHGRVIYTSTQAPAPIGPYNQEGAVCSHHMESLGFLNLKLENSFDFHLCVCTFFEEMLYYSKDTPCQMHSNFSF